MTTTTSPPTISCNFRDERIASIALLEADRSTMKYHQHGCVAVAGGQIIARGTNSYRCQSNDGYLTDTCSCHAEIDVLRKLERILAKKNLSVSRRNGRQCFLRANKYVRRKKR
jgi:tRNA(Arg) A34 adenosine deaminase TadA